LADYGTACDVVVKGKQVQATTQQDQTLLQNQYAALVQNEMVLDDLFA
jgi:hypothetical protein